MGFRAILIFQKFKVALNPMYRIFLNFARSLLFCHSKIKFISSRPRVISSIIIWLAPRAGKMNQILHCDWLPERARWLHLAGGSVAKWSARQTRNPAVPGFESRSGHLLDLFHGTPEFKSSATLVNSQLVCLRPVGILNNVMFKI